MTEYKEQNTSLKHLIPEMISAYTSLAETVSYGYTWLQGRLRMRASCFIVPGPEKDERVKWVWEAISVIYYCRTDCPNTEWLKTSILLHLRTLEVRHSDRAQLGDYFCSFLGTLITRSHLVAESVQNPEQLHSHMQRFGGDG